MYVVNSVTGNSSGSSSTLVLREQNSQCQRLSLPTVENMLNTAPHLHCNMSPVASVGVCSTSAPKSMVAPFGACLVTTRISTAAFAFGAGAAAVGLRFRRLVIFETSEEDDDDELCAETGCFKPEIIHCFL